MTAVRRRARSAALAVAAGLALTACAGTSGGPGGIVEVSGRGPGSLHGTDISDVVSRPALTLPDTSGAPFDLRAQPAGQLTAVFFGYTNCPDVCPTTMADLAAARRRLPQHDKDRLKVVFVTEDPAHDTPVVLRRWLDRFSPTFVGLIGGGARTAAVLTELKAPASEVLATPEPPHDDPTSPGHEVGAHTVEHSGNVYLFTGSKVVVYTGGTTPPEYTSDVETLLKG